MNESKKYHRAQYLARFAYIGSNFYGVQEQPNFPTVLGAVRRRLESYARQPIKALAVSARTDRGVHALENYATFYLKDPVDSEQLVKNFEASRDDGLYALSLRRVDYRVHARGNARGKTYRYTIVDGCDEKALGSDAFAWRVVPRLSIEAMSLAASHLVGLKDFSSLRGGGCQAQSPIKEIYSVSINRCSSGEILVEIHGGSFLRKMIRNMVGLLVEMGASLRKPDSMIEILEKKDRRAAGIMAPAHGLCLIRVELLLDGGLVRTSSPSSKIAWGL